MPVRLTKDSTGKYELPIRQRRQSAKRCHVQGCGNRKPNVGRICAKCKSIRWRANNPEHDYFANLKSSAAKRGIAFTLTLEQFVPWAQANGLIPARGRMPLCLTVDRIRSSEGYRLDNIQVLTMQENSSKRNREGYTPFFAGI